jgi:hypothetical protein
MTDQSTSPDDTPKPTNKKKHNSDQLSQADKNISSTNVYHLKKITLLVIETEN